MLSLWEMVRLEWELHTYYQITVKEKLEGTLKDLDPLKEGFVMFRIEYIATKHRIERDQN